MPVTSERALYLLACAKSRFLQQYARACARYGVLLGIEKALGQRRSVRSGSE